ncbi:MAG TPA: DUF3168 domain-containing protein [Phycisphaerae bacterium]|nr:DUF3168 domain-containing protein [Phycisphaerae bacterium]
MSIETALTYEVTNDETVSELIGSRFYPIGEVPTSAARPYATYQKISGIGHRHQVGASGLHQARYQINVYADTGASADAVRDALYALLGRFVGNMGEEGSQVAVKLAAIEDDNVSFESPASAKQRGTQIRTMDLIVWHEE